MKIPHVKFDTRFTTGIMWTGYLIQQQARLWPRRGRARATVCSGRRRGAAVPSADHRADAGGPVRVVAASAPALPRSVAAAVTADLAPCSGCCCRWRPGAPSLIDGPCPCRLWLGTCGGRGATPPAWTVLGGAATGCGRGVSCYQRFGFPRSAASSQAGA